MEPRVIRETSAPPAHRVRKVLRAIRVIWAHGAMSVRLGRMDTMARKGLRERPPT